MKTANDHIAIPGSYEPVDEAQARFVIAKAKGKFCLFVSEDYGWREWIWFPGMRENEFAHWWVSAATPALRGDFYPAIGLLASLGQQLLNAEDRMVMEVDTLSNTFLQLSAQYKTTLIPRFAWNAADINRCGAGVPAEELLLKWWESIKLTATVLPNEYLWRVKTMCVEVNHGWAYEFPSEVAALVDRDEHGVSGRRWEGLEAHLPIPSFPLGTYFQEVNGVPFLGRYGSYQSALGGRFVGEGYMHDEGRPISEAEFLFLLSFYPQHQVKGLPRYTSRDGLLPDQLPPTYTYWMHDSRLAAISRDGFVRKWPSAGLVVAEEVRAEGEQITEVEFRRHFASYAKLDPGAP
jgi:hypothetical protein